MSKRRLIVGITGATGIIYGVKLVEYLTRRADIELHLVMTEAAKATLTLETGRSPEEVLKLATAVHDVRNMAAPIASGSFRTDGMAIVPCSMNTLSAVAYGYAGNLLTRAADVCLKERRTLVLVPRETPLHLGHLRALAAAAENGAIILPPLPAFYFGPRTVEDLIDHTVGKILDQLNIEHSLFKRWGEA